MHREIKLDGGEITILKTLGSTEMNGKQLVEHLGGMESAEYVDSLSGLMSLGYVLSSKVNVRSKEDIEHASFRVNPAYAHELRDSLNPGRRREQEQTRRRRRS
jgi:hypothetical protein